MFGQTLILSERNMAKTTGIDGRGIAIMDAGANRPQSQNIAWKMKSDNMLVALSGSAPGFDYAAAEQPQIAKRLAFPINSQPSRHIRLPAYLTHQLLTLACLQVGYNTMRICGAAVAQILASDAARFRLGGSWGSGH